MTVPIAGDREPACGWTASVELVRPALPPCPRRLGRRVSDGETVSDRRCDLHSADPDKDPQAIEDELAKMRASHRFECRGWVFPREVDLRNESFEAARFNGTTFAGHAQFDGATFPGDAWFDHATFTGEARFNGATFTSAAWFFGATFTSAAFFSPATFTGMAVFTNAIFTGDAGFSRVTFASNAQFEGATFAGHAAFVGATFAGVAVFSRATFAGNAAFVGATFAEDAWFDAAPFTGIDRFADCKFESAPSFRETRFEGGAGFTAVRFAARTTFDMTVFGPGSTFAHTVVVDLTFRACAMGTVALAEVYGVAKAEFDRVTWGEQLSLSASPDEASNEPRHRINGVTVEEVKAQEGRTKDDYETAERVYRELRRSAEEHKQFQEAHRLSTRELEMRWLSLGTQRPAWWGWLRMHLLSLPAWYRGLSDYGESAGKPLLRLALLLMLSPVVLAAFGIELGTKSDHTEYSLQPLFQADLGAVWSAYETLFVFGLRSAVLLPDPPNIPVFSVWVQLWLVFLRLASPFLALLFSLAIRRRFRR